MQRQTGHMISGMQDFILSHLINQRAQIYCGHHGEGYTGTVTGCSDGMVTVEKDGKAIFVACDKIECIKPLD